MWCFPIISFKKKRLINGVPNKMRFQNTNVLFFLPFNIKTIYDIIIITFCFGDSCERRKNSFDLSNLKTIYKHTHNHEAILIIVFLLF